MKIIINDYAGHPFQFDLSRELARRGHNVWHLYSADVEGAKAAFDASDLKALTVVPVTIGHPVRKYQFHRRLLDEISYGRASANEILSIEPDIIIDANMPLDALKIIRKASSKVGARNIYWLQDMIGHAASRIFNKKWMGLGKLIGYRFLKLEASLVKEADHIVAISEGFEPYVINHGAEKENLTVIHNWAPIHDMPLTSRENNWRKEHFHNETFLFLYSGTLGLKHNPSALLDLAKKLSQENAKAMVVVISEGIGADWLKERQSEEQLPTLKVLPYQPFTILPEVLGAGDVLLTLLEFDAGVFSVPSKILSYMCAGRAQLAAMPKDNLGASLINDTNCGKTTEPDNNRQFVEYGIQLYALPKDELNTFGNNARSFAEQNFNIENIADRFEKETF